VGRIGGEDGFEFGGELGFGGHWINDATGLGGRAGLPAEWGLNGYPPSCGSKTRKELQRRRAIQPD
jgi:hypothetical protein